MKQQPIEHIIFDLTGVLFRSSKLSQFRSIGLFQSLMYIARHQENPVMRFLHILEKIHTIEPSGYPVIRYKETPLPRCISDLMCGYINNSEATTIIDQHIQALIRENYFRSKSEIALMQQIMHTLIKPNLSTLTLTPDKKLLGIIKQLKKNRYRLSLLSNFDKEGYACLAAKYPAIFSLFDNIIISANVHKLKPYKEMYNYVLDSYHLEPQSCLFIDDQEENIEGAEAVGIRSIHYTNLAMLVENLKNYHIVIE